MSELKLPTDLRLEKKLLACVASGLGKNFVAIAPELSAGDFFGLEHQKIWRLMEKMHRSKQAVTRATTGEVVQSTDDKTLMEAWIEVEDVGGMARGEVLLTYARRVRSRSMARNAIRALYETTVRLGEDPDEVGNELARLSAEVATLAGEARREDDDPHSDWWEAIKEFHDPTRGGVTFPWVRLNYMLAGKLRAGELMAIAARTRVGKTTAALNLMVDMARGGTRTCFFSNEMPTAAIAQKAAQLVYGMMSGEVEKALGNWDHRLPQQHLTDIQQHISMFRLQRTGPQMRAAIASLPVRPEVVFVDHLGLVDSGGRSVYERASGAIRDLKTMSADLNLPVVVLCQLNRGGSESEMPTLQQLRDSGRIEEDVDHVFALWSPHFERDNEQERSRILLNIAGLKTKHGPSLTLPLVFNRSTQRITEADEADVVLLGPDEEDE